MPRSLLRIPLSPASLLAVSCLISFSSAQTCYVAQDGGVQRASTWKACPGSASDGFEICCLPGSECGEDMLCHIPSSFGPGPNSWYQAGCTDPTYQSSVCRKDCVYFTNPYVQYSDSTSEWNCCGDDGCNGTASQFTFRAAAPGVLTQIASLNGSPATTAIVTPSSTSTTRSRRTTSTPTTSSIPHASSSTSRGTASTATSATTSHRTNTHRRNTRTPTSSTTPAVATSNPSSSSAAGLGSQDGRSGGLSSGAKIGIGAAIGATGALAILAAIVACFVFRVKRKRSPEEMIGMKHMSDTQSSPSYRASGRQSELDAMGGPQGYPAPRGGNYNDTAAFLASGAAVAPAAVPPLPRQPEPSEYQRQTMFSEAPPMSPTGMAFNDTRGTRDWQSIKSSRHLSSIRTTRDYRFEDLPSRRDSIRTTRDYRFFAPEDEGVPPLP